MRDSGLITKEIIIASYKDDLSFVYRFHEDIAVTIYEKGKGDDWKKQILEDDILTMRDFEQRVDNTVYLPNIGVCSQVYLYHIANNYNSLADINIFIAGDCLHDHKKGTPPNLKAFDIINKSDTLTPEYVNLSGKSGNFPLRGECYHFFNQRAREVWHDLFEEECPRKFTPAIDSTFLVKREAIHRRPVSFYEKALSYINEDCYRQDHWKMDYNGQSVSVMAPCKKNLNKFPHKSPKHFDFAACSFFEHTFQKIFDIDFDQCVVE